MKRKEARQFLDELSEEIAKLAMKCIANGKDVDCFGVKVGLFAGLCYAERLLEDDTVRPDSLGEEAAHLLANAGNAYAESLEDKCSSK